MENDIPDMAYFLNTSVNELLRASFAAQPELRETGPDITKKLTDWARENHLSAQAVTVALIHWLAIGTKEGQDVSQV